MREKRFTKIPELDTPSFIAGASVPALDAFYERSFAAALPAFATHLIPSLLVLTVVAVAWKFEWIGAIALIGLAVTYALSVTERLDIVISGPLALVGVPFLVSYWRHHANVHDVR